MAVLEPRERRLRRGQCLGVVARLAVADQRKDGVVAKRVVIVLVFVTGDDAVDPLPHHRQQRVVRIAACLMERGGELLGEADPLVKLADQEQPRVARQPTSRDLDDDTLLRMKPQALRPHTLSTYDGLRVRVKVLRYKHLNATRGHFVSHAVNNP